MVDLYNTARLVGSIEDRAMPDTFYLDRYFTRVYRSTAEEILFDKVVRNRSLAPFVSPMAEGKVMKKEGYTTQTFKPAYVKPKHAVIPSEVLSRLPGETLTGGMSVDQRMRITELELMTEQLEMIDVREEWMAFNALLTGAVVVSGEDYPTQTVDFQRDPTLDVTLTGTLQWGQADEAPLTDIESMSTAMSVADHGAGATAIYMSPEAWEPLRKNPEIKELTNTDFKGNTSSLDRGPLSENDNIQMVGVLQGRFRLYVDTRQYEDETGATVRFMPAGDVLLCNPAVSGVRAYGAIMDVDSLQSVRTFRKSWTNDDPSIRYIMTQSAPLTIPTRPNCTGRIKAL